MPSALNLGIDTGGTYTDAVLFDQDRGVVAKAKALTTRHDLTEGIGNAVSAVLHESEADPSSVRLVSLSTTLATNALVEGQGSRAALVMIGFGPEDLKRDGLADALGSDPVLFVPGGHIVHGHETPLDLDPLESVLDRWADDVAAVAIAGYFAVRNPGHELAARDLVRARSRPAGDLQPRTFIKARRTPTGPDDLAQCPPSGDDRDRLIARHRGLSAANAASKHR